MKRWFSAVMIVVASVLLGATVLREPIAHAAQVVDATIVGPLDANGNVMVHEQGTARVTSYDDPGRNAFVWHGFVRIEDGQLGNRGAFAVPAGKRLVVESVSVVIEVPTGQEIVYVGVASVVNGLQLENYYMPATVGGPSQTGQFTTYIASQLLRLYADGGSDVNVYVQRNSTDGVATADINVSGYLIDCSVASCTAVVSAY